MPVRICKGDPIGDAWLLLHQTHDSVIKCEEETFTNVDMSPQQYQVLRAMKYINGTITPTVVANFLDRKPNSITLITDRMEKSGLVKRIRDLEDRRAVRLIVTTEGDKRYEQAGEPANKLPRAILSVLTQEELSTLTRLLQNIRERTFELRNIKDKVIDIDVKD